MPYKSSRSWSVESSHLTFLILDCSQQQLQISFARFRLLVSHIYHDQIHGDALWASGWWIRRVLASLSVWLHWVLIWPGIHIEVLRVVWSCESTFPIRNENRRILINLAALHTAGETLQAHSSWKKVRHPITLQPQLVCLRATQSSSVAT